MSENQNEVEELQFATVKSEQVKPGIKTSELGFSIITAGVLIAAAAGYVSLDATEELTDKLMVILDSVFRIAALLGLGGVAAGYSLSRGMAKKRG